MTPTPEQSRAARAWLKWTQADLAREAHVGVPVVRSYENGLDGESRAVHINHINAIQKAFERAGFTFFVAAHSKGIVHVAIPESNQEVAASEPEHE